MKKVFAILLVLCFCFSAMGMASAEKYIINTETDPLTVRDVNDSSNILGQIRKGTVIDVNYTDKFWAYLT